MEKGWMKRFFARKGWVWCNHVWIHLGQPLKPLSFMCLWKVNKNQIAFLCIIYFSLHNKEFLFSSRISPATDYCTRKLNSIAFNTWAFSVSLGNTRQPDEKLWFQTPRFSQISRGLTSWRPNLLLEWSNASPPLGDLPQCGQSLFLITP